MSQQISDNEIEEISGGTNYSGPVFKYTIQYGDTLSELAVRFGTTVTTLAQINNIANVNKIYAGKTIYIPYKQ